MGDPSSRDDIAGARFLDTLLALPAHVDHREAAILLERVSGIVGPSSAEDWLYTPVPELDDRRPVDLIGSGESRRVLDLIDAVGEGVFA